MWRIGMQRPEGNCSDFHQVVGKSTCEEDDLVLAVARKKSALVHRTT